MNAPTTASSLKKLTILFLLDGGIKNDAKTKERAANIIEDIKKGLNSRLKLIPLLYIAIISVLLAIYDVKKMTDMKINKGLNRLVK